MTFEERLSWLVLGMILGYVLRALQDIKKEVSEVDKSLKKRDRGEDGFMRYPIFADIAVLLIVLMCVYASFSTQVTNNKLEKAISDIKVGQKENEKTRVRLSRITYCSQAYLSKTIEALNQRTTFTQQQADANVKLQQAQMAFLEVVIADPAPSSEQMKEALSNYVGTLQNFATVTGQNKDKTSLYKYPSSEDLKNCLSDDSKETSE